MKRETYERLTERQRIGVLLLCGRAATAILRTCPPSTFLIVECRWTADAIALARMDGGLLDLPEVTRVLSTTPEGNATRWSFIGAEWMAQTMRDVPHGLNADMRALNSRGSFSA